MTDSLPLPSKQPHVVAIDPGGSNRRRSTGVCCWDMDYEPYFMHQYKQNDFWDSLNHFIAPLWIVEGYTINPYIPHGGKKATTSETIGAIKAFARANKIKVVEQPSSILAVAQKWTGREMPKDHSKSDEVSAFLHGEYYLQKAGLKAPRILKEKKKDA